MRLGLFAALGVVLGLAAPGVAAAGPGLVAGVVEDDVRASTLVEAQARMASLRVSGYRAVRITSYWRPGLTSPTGEEMRILQNAGAAGAQSGIRVFITVMQQNWRTTPLADDARREFVSYVAAIARGTSIRHVIVGNEPNLNRFWMPQFQLDGSSASPAAYLTLLAETYDALKAVSPTVRVYGGALSPRGADRPGGIRPTHSPTAFIRELGTAFRASGRDRPVMDALAINPYPDNSSQPPTFAHPKTTTIGVADYEKLVALHGVRRRVADPGRQGGALHGHRADDDEARIRGDAGRVLQAGARAGVLPAHGRGDAALPVARRAVSGGLAVWHLLRGRHPEVEPRDGDRGARPRDGGVHHEVPRRPARRPSDLPQVRKPCCSQTWGLSGELPLRPGLPLPRTSRERRHPCHEARKARASRGRRAGRGRPRVPAPGTREVPLHAQPGTPGEPSATDGSNGSGLRASVVLSSGARAATRGRARTRRR
jgi:hypothetical protein